MQDVKMEVGIHRPGDVRKTKRGVKRQASDSNLDDEQRFTKRFHLLNLDQQANAQAAASAASEDDSSDVPLTRRRSNAYLPVQTLANSTTGADHPMDVDDAKDRVYIGDLDAEIADIDAHQPDDRLIFLPDIEKHFSRIPQHVLTGRRDSTTDDAKPADDQQLVLYSVPRSLTVDQDNDSVRRAIVEARHRARDRAQELAREEDMNRKYASPNTDNGRHATETAHGYGSGYSSEPDNDPDAMDIE